MNQEQPDRRYRVAQCSSGAMGTIALGLVIDDPDLELVTLWAHSPEKAGRDVGTLIGRDPIGIETTNDFDSILSADVDCVLYYSDIVGLDSVTRESDVKKDLVQILSAGKNVVIPWLSQLHYPDFGARYDGEFIADIEAACASGRSSLVMIGIDPGFCTGVLPLVLSGASSSVKSIRVQEILDHSTFDERRLTAPDFFCFGQPMDHNEPNFINPALVKQGWGTTPALLAAALGYDLDHTEFFEHRAPAISRLEFSNAGVVEPGTIGARWFGLSGKVPEGPEVTFEHFSYVGDSLPVDWPVPQPVNPGYRVLIEGFPSLDVHLCAHVDGDEFWGAMALTATSTTNIVPAVCDAPPGIIDPFSLSVGDLTHRHKPR